MNYYLLVYDRQRHKIIDQEEFSLERRDEALAARAKLVHQYRESPEIEIVLLGANSFDDLKKTHGRYFKSAKQLVKA